MRSYPRRPAPAQRDGALRGDADRRWRELRTAARRRVPNVTHPKAPGRPGEHGADPDSASLTTRVDTGHRLAIDPAVRQEECALILVDRPPHSGTVRFAATRIVAGESFVQQRVGAFRTSPIRRLRAGLCSISIPTAIIVESVPAHTSRLFVSERFSPRALAPAAPPLPAQYATHRSKPDGSARESRRSMFPSTCRLR